MFLSLSMNFFRVHKINQLSRLVLIILLTVYSLSACKKEKKTYTPVPFLTGRTWIADTITINPPLTYNQLSSAEQESYRRAVAWFKAQLTFNEDGSVTCGGDWDYGYTTWRLINNDADIEVFDRNGNKHILHNWVADAVHLSYTLLQNSSFDCSLVYR